jgi:hypothetical protein
MEEHNYGWRKEGVLVRLSAGELDLIRLALIQAYYVQDSPWYHDVSIVHLANKVGIALDRLNTADNPQKT